MNDINGNDVLILHYINKNSRASELNQKFWKDILYNDNEKSLQKLLEGGYIEYKDDYFTSLNKLKVDELKNILRSEKLKLNENKSELIERIIKTSSLSSYQEYIKKERVITPKGLEVVNNSDFILLMHDMNIGYPCDLYNCYLSNKELNKVDLVIKFVESKNKFEKEIYTYTSNAFRYSQLSEVLIKYNAKNKALYYLLKSCFDYLSDDMLDYSTDTLKSFKEQVKRIDFYTNKIKNLLQANPDLKNNLPTYYQGLTKLYTLHYFTNEEIESLITACYLKNSYGIDAIINRIYKRNKEQGKLKNPREKLNKELELYRQQKEEKLLIENNNKEKKKGFFSSLISFILKEK
ncbi:SAP domain-containing protein [Gemella bergeri]